MQHAPDDIVSDILARLRRQVGTVDAEFWQLVEEEIRRDWGGDRPYVAKTSEAHVRYITQRDAVILRDWQRGESVALLSRRYQLTERRIRQIIERGRA